MDLERIDNLPTDTISGFRIRPGRPLPFGVSSVPGGLNYSVAQKKYHLAKSEFLITIGSAMSIPS
jgi:hypothetical protein